MNFIRDEFVTKWRRGDLRDNNRRVIDIDSCVDVVSRTIVLIKRTLGVTRICKLFSR